MLALERLTYDRTAEAVTYRSSIPASRLTNPPRSYLTHTIP